MLTGGAAEPAQLVDRGKAVCATTMTYTLSADPRVADAALGAAFLAELKRLLEVPRRLLQ